MVLCGPTTKDESGLKMAQRLCSRVADRATLALTEPAYESAPASGRVRVPTAIIHTLIRLNLFYPGVLTPSLSISTALKSQAYLPDKRRVARLAVNQAPERYIKLFMLVDSNDGHLGFSSSLS